MHRAKKGVMKGLWRRSSAWRGKIVGTICVVARRLFLVLGIFLWVLYVATRPFFGRGEVCMYSFVNSSLFSCRDVVHFIRCLISHKKPCANIGPGDEVKLYPCGILMSSWSGQELWALLYSY